MIVFICVIFLIAGEGFRLYPRHESARKAVQLSASTFLQPSPCLCVSA